MHPQGSVIITSGHMIDAPDRQEPRFPASAEVAVAVEIDRLFEQWAVGPDDVVFSGAACGADILFAESAARHGAEVVLLLALPPEEFERSSVALPGTTWSQRFRTLLRQHRSEVLAAGDGSPDVFARNNHWMIARALDLTPPATLKVALVWDGQPAAGPGGTGDFADLAHRLHAPLAIIDPSRAADAVAG